MTTALKAFNDGCNRLRAEFQLPDDFSAEVRDEAEEAAKRPLVANKNRVDLRDLPFLTLDPATSIDLDQAFALSIEGDNLLLHYAIADVGFFVDQNSAIEEEAFRRGETTYLPQHRIPQYPGVLCEAAASLLPNVDRPAVVMEVLLAPSGEPTMRTARRAIVRSTRKLAYESTSPADIEHLEEFSRRIVVAEDRRGAARSEVPEQSVELNEAGHPILGCRDLLPSEAANSALSLSANLAAAKRFLDAGIGLFRVMDRPDDHEVSSLRREARSLGLQWPRSQTVATFQRSLHPGNPVHRSLLISARRLGGGASYATIGCSADTDVTNDEPFHSAIAAPYAHVTAPLRRLADRYALDLLVDICAGNGVDAYPAVLSRLPEVMRTSGKRSSQVERAVIDLAEAVVLSERVGEVFRATVLEDGDSGSVIQLDEPAVRARLPRRAQVDAGEVVTVSLTSVDIEQRNVRFALVANDQ